MDKDIALKMIKTIDMLKYYHKMSAIGKKIIELEKEWKNKEEIDIIINDMKHRLETIAPQLIYNKL